MPEDTVSIYGYDMDTGDAGAFIAWMKAPEGATFWKIIAERAQDVEEQSRVGMVSENTDIVLDIATRYQKAAFAAALLWASSLPEDLSEEYETQYPTEELLKEKH